MGYIITIAIIGIVIGVVWAFIEEGDLEYAIPGAIMGAILGAIVGAVVWGVVALAGMGASYDFMEENASYSMRETSGAYLVRTYDAEGSPKSCTFTIIDDMYVQYEIDADCDDITVKPIESGREAIRTSNREFTIYIGLNDVLDYRLPDYVEETE